MHKSIKKAVIRIPLLPIDCLKNIRLQDLSASNIIQRLSYLCSPNVLEALYVSTPEFTKTIELIINNKVPSIEHAKLLDIWLTFSKYYSRMCSRATPYGLMSSVGIISLDDSTFLESNFEGFVHAQLDNGIVSELSDKLQNLELIQDKLCYFPNPSIYRQGNKLKYIEVFKKEGHKTFDLSKIEVNNVINDTLTFSISGKNKKDIVNYLKHKFADVYSREDIEKLVHELIGHQIILSNYSPTPTGKTLFSTVVSHLNDFTETMEEASLVCSINEQLLKVSKQDWTTNKPLFVSIENLLKELGCSPTSSPLLVNFVRSFSGSSLNLRIAEKIKGVVELLASVNEIYKLDSLEDFKVAFFERYENQYVPLSEVLDEETGIGYPKGNIRNKNTDGVFDDIAIPQQGYNSSKSNIFNAYYLFLLNKITELKASNSKILAITSSDLKDFVTTKINLPPTYSIFCNLIGESAEQIDNGNYHAILTTGATSTAVNPLNRFSVSDKEIAKLSKEIVDHETRLFKDKIVAEVLHSPNSRIENITFRSVSRDFEIPIETLSSSQEERQIKLSDILVNVVGNKVTLISKRHKKEIIPKISNSHSFSNSESLPAYRFLGDLQLQGHQNQLLWNWGPLAKLNFLPRVVVDNQIICSLATWRVTLNKSFFVKTEDLPDKLKNELQNLGLPKHVTLQQNNDNLLVLDLDDPTCLLILLKEFKKFPYLIFHEYLSTADNSFLKDDMGRFYVNELVIPYLQENQNNHLLGLSKIETKKLKSIEKRSFFPGENFLYLKIYCTRNIGQQILIQKLSTIFLEFKNTPYIAFFVRYEDPEFHIRIRICKKDSSLYILRIYKCLEKFIKNKLIYRIQTDTYNRELNRYFAISYGKTELIFSFDSITIIEILKQLNKRNIENVTWIIGVKNIYSYLKNFDMTLDEMLSFCMSIRNDFFAELALDNKEFLKSMNAKLKKNHKLMNSIMNETNIELQELFKIFKVREKKITSILKPIEKIKIRKDFGHLSSYIHMSLNRLFSSDQRFKEAICYDLLYNFLIYQKKGAVKIHS